MAAALAKVLLDSQLRASLRALSRQRAQPYTTERAVIGVRQSYEKALASSMGRVILPADSRAELYAENRGSTGRLCGRQPAGSGCYRRKTVNGAIARARIGGMIARIRQNLTAQVTGTVLDPLVQQLTRFNHVLSEALAARLGELQQIGDSDHAAGAGGNPGLPGHVNDLLGEVFYAGLDQIDAACLQPPVGDHSHASVASLSALVDAMRDLGGHAVEDFYQICKRRHEEIDEPRGDPGVDGEFEQAIAANGRNESCTTRRRRAGFISEFPPGQVGQRRSPASWWLPSFCLRWKTRRHSTGRLPNSTVGLDPGRHRAVRGPMGDRARTTSSRRVVSRIRAYLIAHVRAYFIFYSSGRQDSTA